jgi:Transcriptional regulator of a riboflavin/FAD biosynthetic operon
VECVDRRLVGDLLALSRVEGLPVAEAAGRLCMTRQGLYKILRSLRERGYVEEGPVVKLSQRGRDILSAALRELLSYFNIVSIRLVGVVVSGLGEGAFYISLEGYRRVMEELLGFVPYPGTLNIKLDPQSLAYRRYLESLPGILIPGFTNGMRTYGAVKAFRARIRGVEGAVVMPERTHHPTDVIEVVAPVKLRDVLGLRDGDRVEIEIYL